MADTKIEWTDKSWNPVTGCSRISEGCQNCYAERMAKRLAGRYGYPKDEPFRVTLHPKRLDEPLKWRKPSRIFVSSMGDLFHEKVPFDFVESVFMAMKKPHTYLVLTKRPERLRQYIWEYYNPPTFFLNLPFIWFGVSVENQKTADERIPILLQIPAKVRFVSIEPMLGPVDLSQWIFKKWEAPSNRIRWLIVGGESGPRARPMHPDWVRSVRDQCQEAGVPFFFKNMGSAHEPELAGKITAGRLIDGKMWEEWPK